jgi:hypothetical protein
MAPGLGFLLAGGLVVTSCTALPIDNRALAELVLLYLGWRMLLTLAPAMRLLR